MLILEGLAAVAAIVAGTDSPPAAATLAPGTVAIAPAAGPALSSEAARVFDDAVQRAMLRARFTPLPGQGHGRYAASVTVTRTSRGVVAAEGRPAPPPLANLNGSVSVALSPGGERLSDLVVTELKVVLSRRGDARPVWSGSAVTARVTGNRTGGIDLVAQTLADAVMAQFPRQAAGPVSIP
ncbi:hypothetical protein FHT00_002883 [Sphingomonas insulae]|uniref:DUF4136 domain-containing protein n=1 Tax=Sphingomonas insulae TaxID=424800 RepID=A0ABP3SUI1_9SPHN|nr:hypothetical protein [Sphingomonas insulae]NIJ30910.1 hypothetical protein [Sphingomonas insulae]